MWAVLLRYTSLFMKHRAVHMLVKIASWAHSLRLPIYACPPNAKSLSRINYRNICLLRCRCNCRDRSALKTSCPHWVICILCTVIDRIFTYGPDLSVLVLQIYPMAALQA